MSEMVERIADAICRSYSGQGLDKTVKHDLPDRDWYMAAARTAIKAMREPTTEMLDAACAAKKKHNEEWPGGTENEPCARDPSGEDYWHAMIDAALRE